MNGEMSTLTNVSAALFAALLPAVLAPSALGQTAPAQTGGEAHLILPDLSQGLFLGTSGRTLLMGGLLICASAWSSA